MADYYCSFKMLPTVRLPEADFRLQSNNLIIINSSHMGRKNMRPADSALGIFRSPDPDLCVLGRRILRPRDPSVEQDKMTCWRTRMTSLANLLLELSHLLVFEFDFVSPL